MYPETRIIRMFISTRIIDNCDVIILDIKDVHVTGSLDSVLVLTEYKSNAVT